MESAARNRLSGRSYVNARFLALAVVNPRSRPVDPATMTGVWVGVADKSIRPLKAAERIDGGANSLG